MKSIFILAIFFGGCSLAYSQFQFGTPLVPASVELTIVETEQEEYDGELAYKTMRTKIYSSTMNANILWIDKSEMRELVNDARNEG